MDLKRASNCATRSPPIKGRPYPAAHEGENPVGPMQSTLLEFVRADGRPHSRAKGGAGEEP